MRCRRADDRRGEAARRGRQHPLRLRLRRLLRHHSYTAYTNSINRIIRIGIVWCW